MNSINLFVNCIRFLIIVSFTVLLIGSSFPGIITDASGNSTWNFAVNIKRLPEKVDFIPPTKSIPLNLKHLIFIDDNATHANGLYPIRDLLVDLVNANKTVLPAYHVEVEMYDTRYNIEYNVGKTVRLFNEHIANEAFATALKSNGSYINAERPWPLFFGPAYSAEAKVLAQLSPLYSICHISWCASAPELSDKTKYPTFYRMMLSSDELVPVPRALCNYFNVTTVYFAMLDDAYATDPMDKVDFDLQTHNITVLGRSKFQTRENRTIDLMLDSLRLYDARIIIFWSNEYDEYHIFCRSIDRWRAFNERYTSAKYLTVFMSLDDGAQVLTPPDLSDVPGCSKSMLATMLNGSLVVVTSTWGEPVSRLDWGLSTVDFISKAEEIGRTRYGHKDGKLVPLISLAIDAIWLGFLTLDAVDRRLRAETPYPRTLLNFTFESHDMVRMVKEEILKTRFLGITGDVAFRAKGDINQKVTIQQYKPGHLHSEFVNMFTFDIENQMLAKRFTEPLVFGTADGKMPPDKAPPSALASATLTTILIAVCVGFALLVCMFVGCGYQQLVPRPQK